MEERQEKEHHRYCMGHGSGALGRESQNGRMQDRTAMTQESEDICEITKYWFQH
jgi:hypothetical protein